MSSLARNLLIVLLVCGSVICYVFLRQVARRTTLFSDPAAEFSQLTHIIKTDIATLRGELDHLAEFVASNRSSHGSGVQQDTHSAKIVENLKVQLATTARSFSEILQSRTKV